MAPYKSIFDQLYDYLGLFHKGGSLSGSPLGIWPIPYNQTDIAKKQARILGCPDDTSANIVKCLKTKSAEDIGNSLLQFRVSMLSFRSLIKK